MTSETLSRLLVAGAAVAAFGVAGCNTTTSAKLLDNLSTDCERHYDGTVSGGMTGGAFSGTVKIDCAPAKPAAAPPT